MKNYGKRVLSILLFALMLFGMIPNMSYAAEPGRFVLVVEKGSELVVAPEYITYTEGQTVGEALASSGHTFTGLDAGWITAIDDVTGNYRRSDEDGDYDLTKSASEIGFYRFTEEEDNGISVGLQSLMTAMADYLLEEDDVKAAAKAEYDTAQEQFVGIGSDSAATLAKNLTDKVSEYKTALNGTKYSITFQNQSAVINGAEITVKNAYGRVWSDDNKDGIIEVPAGTYEFHIEQAGNQVEGSISVSGALTVNTAISSEDWLNTESFRLSGSYGADATDEDGETESGFSLDEFAIGSWTNRSLVVPVKDTFTGTVYTYAEYQKLASAPTLTAVYAKAGTENETEVSIPFASLVSGTSNVLKRGAQGNTVIYRISAVGDDGYTYSQDYTVTFERTPTLAFLSVEDQDGTDQAATEAFDSDVTEYTYKVLDEVTSVTVKPSPFMSNYTVKVNGEVSSTAGTTVAISGETKIEVEVSYGDYTNRYILTILPGEGQKITFKMSTDVTLKVVNSNGLVMPYKKYLSGSSYNMYQYTLVAEDSYNYVATKNTYYHTTADFTLDTLANTTVTVTVPTTDWMTGLYFGGTKASADKGKIELEPSFAADTHSYSVEYIDTEANLFGWAYGSSGASISASYDQISSLEAYNGKTKSVNFTTMSSLGIGKQLSNVLMAENPIENTVTFRLTKTSSGVTHYQDYIVDIHRTLTLKNISASYDGLAAPLVPQDGTDAGYSPAVTEYTVTVPMRTTALSLDVSAYTENKCYGEEAVGYRIYVNGTNVTAAGTAEVPLDGTVNAEQIVVRVENDKAPDGGTDYTIKVLKTPPIDTYFELSPADAQLNLTDALSGERLVAESDGSYLLCEGGSYNYTFTKYGYVSKYGTLTVTRDSADALVIQDGENSYPVTESDSGGGLVRISWSITEAAKNSSIDTSLSAAWPNFRGNDENNAVTDAKIPTEAEEGTLYWANKIGDGIDSGAVGSPIIVNDELITYAGDTIFRIDMMTGEVLKEGTMTRKSSFSITPPAYSDGMVFVALSNGTVQAFNAVTLESLWVYSDPLGGQPNCPLTIQNGYLYTGFWNSETNDANFVCLPITDEDPDQTNEQKCAAWYHTQKGGFYWAGSYANDDFVLVGTDDGGSGCTDQTSQMLMFSPKSGILLDSWDNLNGDIRSTVVYDSETDAYYFTTKGGSFYSFKVQQTTDGWEITDTWEVTLSNGSSGYAMSTCSPAVYNGRAYIGVCGTGQFTNYSGHNITVIDLKTKSIAYSVRTQGYPQTSGLVTTAYEDYVYVYFFDNATPGKLRALRDKAGQTSADYVTIEGSYTTAYALFTPSGAQAQYAICSPIVDEYGTIYFKNDSAYLMAYGSAIEKIEVTTQPNKTNYKEGDKFDPTGMVVTATYTNGLTRDVTSYVTYSEDELTTADTSFTISFEHVMYHNVENGTSMTAGVTTATPTTTITLTFNDAVLGDVNGDGSVTEADAQMILDYEAQKLEKALSLESADISGDGVIDSNDAVLILQYLKGMISLNEAEE